MIDINFSMNSIKGEDILAYSPLNERVRRFHMIFVIKSDKSRDSFSFPLLFVFFPFIFFLY